MRLEATRIDPATGEADPHGIPQIACPARQDDVNPQFTCRSCPCAREVEAHQAVDDLGQPFHIVDAVECGFDGGARVLPAVWRRFPSLLEGIVEDAPPRLEPGVACPLLASPERFARTSVAVEGIRWVPASNCGTCQFFRGVDGSQVARPPGDDAGIAVVCAAPRAED